MIESDLVLGIGGEAFLVNRIETVKHTVWWCFVEQDGSPAYKGIEIAPLSSGLPDDIEINGLSLRLVPVKIWNKHSKTYSEETEPFEKTRHYSDQVEIEETKVEIKLRVTLKKNGRWNLSCRAWPTRKDSHSPRPVQDSFPQDEARLRKAQGPDLPSGGIFDAFR